VGTEWEEGALAWERKGEGEEMLSNGVCEGATGRKREQIRRPEHYRGCGWDKKEKKRGNSSCDLRGRNEKKKEMSPGVLWGVGKKGKKQGESG